MNNRIDISDLEVGARIRVGDNDLATIKYIGEVIIKTKIFQTNSHKSSSPPFRGKGLKIWAFDLLLCSNFNASLVLFLTHIQM